jgi:REP element-mobilizing transposase RayT
MARPLRIEYEGAVYYVTARGNERNSIFFSKTDYDGFLQYLIEAKYKYDIVLHCYVLMSNHYHLYFRNAGGQCPSSSKIGKLRHNLLLCFKKILEISHGMIYSNTMEVAYE